MSIYADYFGNMTIPEDRKEEFCRNVEIILKQGGILDIVKMEFMGKEIFLLADPQYDQYEKLSFDYNYFSDEIWDRARFSRKECSFSSEKVGRFEFQQVVSAIYLLYEFYTEEYGLSELNGAIVDQRQTIGWLNKILGTSFTNQRATNLWKMYEHLHMFNVNAYSAASEILMSKDTPMNAIDWCKVYYVEKGVQGIKELLSYGLDNTEDREHIDSLNPLSLIIKMEDSAKQYIDTMEGGTIEKYQKMLDILKKSPDEVKILLHEHARSGGDKNKKMFFFTFCLLGTTFAVKTVSEVMELDFWELWDQVKTKAFDVSLWNDTELDNLGPEPVVSTSEFFCIPDSAPIFNKPQNNEAENFHFSDDDMLYFWSAQGDIQLSDKITDWMHKLKKEYDLILDEIQFETDYKIFALHFANTLNAILEEYEKVFMFHDTFWEFVMNWREPYVQVFLEMLDRMSERNKAENAILKRQDKMYWGAIDRNISFNPGRVEIKRFMALLGNKKLREKTFDTINE